MYLLSHSMLYFYINKYLTSTFDIVRTMINKVKKNWKNILLVLFACFSLNKCTQSCNRAGEIDNLKIQIEQKDSCITTQSKTIDGLARDTADYLNQIRMYRRFDSKQTEYIRQRNVTDSINAVNTAKQKAQTDALIKQNQELINKQNNK